MADATLLALMYHDVVPEAGVVALRGKIQSSYVVGTLDFRRQMEHLSQSGWVSLDMEAAGRLMREGCLPGHTTKRFVVITFDDGFAGNYRLAFPIMQELHLIGNFFLIASLMDTPDMLSWAEIREMREHGMSFGSHGLTHRPLGSLSRRELTRELVASKRHLEDHIAAPVDFLSLPHGSQHAEYRAAALEAGYRGGFTSQPGVNRPGCDHFYLKRMSVRRNTSFRDYQALCALEAGIFRRARIKAFVMSSAKRAVGERVFLQVYNRFFGVADQA